MLTRADRSRRVAMEVDKMAVRPNRKTYRASIAGLLSGHWGALLLGLVAVGIETAAALLEPWPIKVVLDTVLHSRRLPRPVVQPLGATSAANAMVILQIAAAAVLLIAIVAAAASYAEKQ